MQSFDVIVVGAGAMGSATAYQLATSGVNVLAIDQFDPPHSQGSSGGDTRITRFVFNAGSQKNLVRRAHEIWRELEAAAGVDLFADTGGVFLGIEPWIAQLAAEADEAEIQYEMLSSGELARRFPEFRTNDDERGAFEPTGGVLRPARCIETQLGLAEQRGAVVRRNEKVLGIDETATGVIVRTDLGSYSASRVVVTAGPWVSRFLDETLSAHIRTLRQVLYWFDIESNYERFKIGSFPTFVWRTGAHDHEMFYGFPAVDGPNGGLKMACEQYDVTSDPDAIDRTVSKEEIDSMYENFASRIDGISRNVVRAAACTYTVTDGWTYIIDWLPGSERVLIASPCIGRGFKHSAAIGESLAQLVTNGQPTIDLSDFRLVGRF